GGCTPTKGVPWQTAGAAVPNFVLARTGTPRANPLCMQRNPLNRGVLLQRPPLALAEVSLGTNPFRITGAPRRSLGQNMEAPRQPERAAPYTQWNPCFASENRPQPHANSWPYTQRVCAKIT